MDRLQKNQMDFINLRLGTFIHFNSATVQFQEGSMKDWEWEYENTDDPRRFPFAEKDWNPRGLDCRQWAQIAKSAACKTDVVAEFLSAFREEGIKAGLSVYEYRLYG